MDDTNFDKYVKFQESLYGVESLNRWREHFKRVVEDIKRHETRITNTGKTLKYQAVCSCGWKGSGQAEWHKADTDATEHREIGGE